MKMEGAEDVFPPRNDQGRPVVPHPTKPNSTRTLSRPSSYGKTLTDSYQIERAYRRKMLRGAGLRPALAEQAIPLDPKADRLALDALVEEAARTGGDGDRAKLGTMMHDVWERFLRSGEVVDVAEQYVATRDAVIRLLTEANLRPLDDDWIEPFVINDSHDAAGQFDFATYYGGRPKPVIADFKTGAWRPTEFDMPITYGCQLYLYATATRVWRGLDQEPEPIPEDFFDKELALIVWAPADGDGTVELIEVDLTVCADLCELAAQVRESRGVAVRRAIMTPVSIDALSENTGMSTSVDGERAGAPEQLDPAAGGSPIQEPEEGESAMTLEPSSERGAKGEGIIHDAPERPQPLGSELAAQVGSLRKRLTRLVDRTELTKQAVNKLMVENKLPPLTKLDEQTHDTVADWSSLVATLELGMGLHAPHRDRLEASIELFEALEPEAAAEIEAAAKEQDVPHLKSGELTDRDLDILDRLITRHNVRAQA
ncbi:MAG: hypothetical protein HKN01_01415 [Acidimicrobiia bacterium]|nr:hypothetical protein [Acidimicrobiia bacterium]